MADAIINPTAAATMPSIDRWMMGYDLILPQIGYTKNIISKPGKKIPIEPIAQPKS